MPIIPPCRAGLVTAAPLIVIGLLAMPGCSGRDGSAAVSIAPPPITPVPVRLTMKQRSTQAVPGTGGKLTLTIDDITRGQVMAQLAVGQDTLVLTHRSFAPHASHTFDYGGQTYRLTLKALDNALIGEDFATFEITDATQLTERQKIQRLIAAIRGMDGAVFIRNGKEYDAPAAADHLRMKWDWAGDRIQTADQFITLLASKSSASGKPYHIRLADGREVESGPWLRQRLQEMEADDAHNHTPGDGS